MNTLLNPAKLQAIADVLAGLGDVPGDMAELGVYRGGVSRMLAQRCPGRTVHLFDTFSGIPATADPEIDGHKPGEWAAGLEQVKAYLADYLNVRLHPGLFPHTTAGMDDVRFAFVHLDADLYTSTLDGLRWFWPRVSVGGVVVLDDWQWSYCRGVDKAIGEFFFGDLNRDGRFSTRAENQLIATKV